jgi:hypothetical protein
MTYSNLTACSSGPEARMCILLVPFERKRQLKVREYKTIDLVEENTKKKPTIFLYFLSTAIFEIQQKGPKSSHHSCCNSDRIAKSVNLDFD